MRVPRMRGVIERRILVNYRVDPDVLAAALPKPFRPKLCHGYGVAGICLIRLRHVRPPFLPAVFGLSSENAAHRVAVRWDHNDEVREGVYIPRRDTSSRLNTMIGGRLFPGVHHHAKFDVAEDEAQFRVEMNSDDGQAHVLVESRVTPQLPPRSVFRSVRQASDFFAEGSLGYSDTGTDGLYDGLELKTFDWRVQPLEVAKVESNWFDDSSRFPAGSIEFDCALLMREIEHEWCQQPSLCCEPATS